MPSTFPTATDGDARLLDALSSLKQIGAVINGVDAGQRVSVEATLRLVVEGAVKVVPGASAVIYAYDQGRAAFDAAARVSAGEQTAPVPGDQPRPNGLGMRAIGQRRRVLSYEEPDLDIHPIKVQAGARAVACFPLAVARQIVGALYIYLHEDRP